MGEIKVEAQQAEKGPDIIKVINGVTYVVRAHFREGSGETMEQKIKRMLRTEVTNMNLAV